jgi:hypothetical protein
MYLFFVRHFNDIDHMTPIVWKLNRTGYSTTVYCMNPAYDIKNDYRLLFLKSLGVTVEYLHDAFGAQSGVIYPVLKSMVVKCSAIEMQSNQVIQKAGRRADLTVKITERLRTWAYKLLRKWYFTEEWAQHILSKTRAQVICFDHVMPKHYVVDVFLRASHRLGIPSLALPHGVYLYTNDATKPKATDERRVAKFSRFDHIVATNELRKSLLVNSGVAADKIVVLGSARYCGEWLEQNNRILPGSFDAPDRVTDKLKVVLMPSKPQCQLDLDRLFSTCRIMAEVDGVEALIKPHTRISDRMHLFDNIPLHDVSAELTAELCNWADVLINVGSSVITEALMRDKPAIYLKYLHPNITRFEELGACWTITAEHQLEEALLTLRSDKRYRPYNQEAVTRFITEVVQGDSDDPDVLGRYERFIVACATEKQHAVR